MRYLPAASAVLVLSIYGTLTSAAVLDKRVIGANGEGSSETNPHQLSIDCSGVSVETCNDRCQMILCNDVLRTYVFYGGEPHATDARKDSGALAANKGTDQQRENRGVPGALPHPWDTSLEEGLRASADHGGLDEVPMVQTGPDANREEGSHYQAEIRRNNVERGEWVRENWRNYGTNAPFCAELMKPNPSKSPLCDKIGQPGHEGKTVLVRSKKDETSKVRKRYRSVGKKEIIANLANYHPGKGTGFKRDLNNKYQAKRAQDTKDISKRNAPTFAELEKGLDYKFEGFDTQAQLDQAIREALVELDWS